MARDIAREERAVFFQGVLILKSSLYSGFIQDLEAHQQNMFYEVCTFCFRMRYRHHSSGPRGTSTVLRGDFFKKNPQKVEGLLGSFWEALGSFWEASGSSGKLPRPGEASPHLQGAGTPREVGDLY